MTISIVTVTVPVTPPRMRGKGGKPDGLYLPKRNQLESAFPLRFLIFLCLLLVITLARAQDCEHHLGDPVVHISFGAGTKNIGPALQTGIVRHTYNPSVYPGDGHYSIARKIGTNTWNPLSKDHTGDPNGYYLFLNINPEPGSFYRDTFPDLCPNTTYRFSIWVINALRTTYKPSCACAISVPDLSFYVQTLAGTTLQQYNTGPIKANDTAIWVEHSFYFTTATDTHGIVLNLQSNTAGGTGNDVLIDDIVIQPCQQQPESVFTQSAAISEMLCAGTTQQTRLQAGNTSLVTGQWQVSPNGTGWRDVAGATTPASSIPVPDTTAPGTYWYRFSNLPLTKDIQNSCRITSNEIALVVNPSPAAKVNGDITLCKGESKTLHATGGDTYQWLPVQGLSNPRSSTPRVSPEQTTRYKVSVSNRFGCTALDSVNVQVNTPPQASAGRDQTIEEGQSARLTGSYTGSNVSHYWTSDYEISDPASLTPVVTPAKNTRYTLHVTADCGIAAANVTVKVNLNIAIPNIFTPNGDGIHDTWVITGLSNYPESEVLVFTRNGTPVFRSTGTDVNWDGTSNGQKLPAGTYYYVVDTKNGTARKSGSVTIL